MRRSLCFAFSVTALLLPIACGDDDDSDPLGPEPVAPDPMDPATVRPLHVHVLDIGRGDAILVENGESRVVIDGGHVRARFAAVVDEYELDGRTIDAVILTHPHSDHASGLRELFVRDREIEIAYFFDNESLTSSSTSAQTVRDSARARSDRGELIYRDAADPCGDGSTICTLPLAGGGRLHVMQPFPEATNPDDGSIPVKLVGPDSASLTMWLAGDARYSAIEWFESGAGYHLSPGMDVDILKGQEHGHCRSTTQRLLDLTDPEWVTFSLEEDDGSGRVHEQTKAMLTANGVPWYRTDQNGTITITSPGTPGGGYTIVPSRGVENQDGAGDDVSTSGRCS